MSILTDEIARRRTFAIISHPDAGKTTLTEKLLLFGGAIQLTGEVKARGERRRVRLDWMAVERERGISVSSAVMSFEHEGLAFNLLDTPGHEDLSPLGFQRRHLPHPDRGRQRGCSTPPRASRSRPANPSRSAAARRADHHLCQQARPRGPRPDRPAGRDRASLALDVTSASWPVGMGRDFLGTYDLFADALLLFERGVHDRVTEPVRCSGLDDPKLLRLLPKAALAKLREEVEMAKGLCPPFDAQAYREGHLTPVYFGSALNNFPEAQAIERASASRGHGDGTSLAPPQPKPG